MTNISSGEDPAIKLVHDELEKLLANVAGIKDQNLRVFLVVKIDRMMDELTQYIPEEDI